MIPKLAISAGSAMQLSEPEALPGPRAADLLAWYERHGRTLPWRTGPRERAAGVRPDPYRVWLSEVMLQQTTVRAVAPFFARFVERWPTVRDLAHAEDNAVMAAWAGLGYYSRARNLLACARAVADRPGADFPRTAAELAQLPGVGPYTGAAIAALAFDEPVAVVDGNVERVITRLFAIELAMPAAKSAVREALQPLVPRGRPAEFAEALMDLGATICTPRRPACAICPWFAACKARRAGQQAAFPVKAPKRARPTRYGTAFVARRADGAVLLRRRPARGLLGSMCEVPGTPWSEPGPEHPSAPFAAEWRRIAAPVEHSFTHFELRLTVLVATLGHDPPAPEGSWWSQPDQLGAEGLPTLMRKVISAAGIPLPPAGHRIDTKASPA